MGPRQPGQRPRRRSVEAPADRQPEAFEQALARLVGERRLVEQLDEDREIGDRSAALGEREPPPPAEPALVAERLVLGRCDEQGQGFLDLALRAELLPQDVRAAREAVAEPARHRQPERVVEGGPGDARVVEPARRPPQLFHPRREVRQRPRGALEHLGVIGIGLEKAEGLVELAERARLPGGRSSELIEQADLLPPVRGCEARRCRRERPDEGGRGHRSVFAMVRTATMRMAAGMGAPSLSPGARPRAPRAAREG